MLHIAVQLPYVQNVKLSLRINAFLTYIERQFFQRFLNFICGKKA